MSRKNIKTIPIIKKRKIEGLQRFRDSINQYQSELDKVTNGKNYQEILHELQKVVMEAEKNVSLSELSELNSELFKTIQRADIGDVLRDDIIECTKMLINNIDNNLRSEVCNAVEDLLKGAETREEMIERVADLILSNK